MSRVLSSWENITTHKASKICKEVLGLHFLGVRYTMPSKHPLPIGLRKLKEITGYKGARFAKLVGIPYDTLKSIESGRLKMSEEVTRKIVGATGVASDSLFKAEPRTRLIGVVTEFPKSGPLDAYTEDYFHAYRSKLLALGKNKGTARSMAKQLARSIEFYARVLLLAAVENGKSVSYWSIYDEIAFVIKRLGEQKGLMPSIKSILHRFPIQDSSPRNHLEDGTEVEYTKRDWRAASKELKEHFGVTEKELRRMRDYEPYPKTVTVYPGWHPENGVEEDVFKRKK